jgi:WhiB family transcriptional regulator, redox-sensing transcriptional regulator
VIPADLFAELAGAPRLPGARCRGRWELFDYAGYPPHGVAPHDIDYARQAALNVCASCPALQSCRDWIQTLPPELRPLGVIAGRITHKSSAK